MARPDLPRPTEDELIARYFAPLAAEGAFALRDDAAVTFRTIRRPPSPARRST